MRKRRVEKIGNEHSKRRLNRASLQASPRRPAMALQTRSSSKKAQDSSTHVNGSAAGAPPAAALVDEDALHHEWEFGGPAGVTAMMLGFPALFYYLYVCLFFYDGPSLPIARCPCHR